MGTETNLLNKEDRNSPEYLAQLLKDKKQIQAFPNVFLHAERLIDEEINKVRVALFHINTNKEGMILPEANGPIVSLQEKVFVPVKEYPDFNFVGRILGPRGMTAKQLEQDTGCKIMVRGKGSMRDKKKNPIYDCWEIPQEDLNRGKPNWEHLNDELHVLITVEDTRNRSELKLKRAVDEVRKLLVPAPEGEDDLKKRQLMELAIINGTYRDTKSAASPNGPITTTHASELWGLAQWKENVPRMMGPPLTMPPQMRSPQPAGAPLILAPRMPVSTASMLNGGPPPLMTPAEAGLIYPYATAADYHHYGLAPATMLEYQSAIDQSAAGAAAKVRRAVSMREHPYTRVSLT